MNNFFDKVYGCLCGLVIGDSMGMPTEFMTPKDIKNRYGYVENLVEPGKDHIHNDMSRGMITDDSEVTIEIIKEIIKCKKIDLSVAVNALKNWAIEKDVFNKSYLGPNSAKAIIKLLEGVDPIEAGKYGTTIGAAMRVTPAGIYNAGNINKAIDDAVTLSLPTHGTNVAISGASCIAASIAAALCSDSSMDSIIKAAFYGANEGEKRGTEMPDASVSKRLELALKLTENEISLREASEILYEYIGCNMETNELVPVIIALFKKSNGNMMEAIKTAVNMGGDTDTIGALAGALCGAFTGTKFMDRGILNEIERINRIDIKDISIKFIQSIKETI